MKNTLIILILVGFCAISLYGQGTSRVENNDSPKYNLSPRAQDQLMKRGDSLYAHAAYMESVRLFEAVEHSADIDLRTKAKMAEAYRCNAEYELAEYWYRQYVNDGTDARTCLNFAKVLQSNDKCDEASIWYKRYLSTNPLDANDIEVLADCENLKAITEHKEVIFYNMEEVNTPAAEYGAMIMQDNLVFTSTRDLHKIAKHEDMWTDAEFSDLFMASADEFGVFNNIDRLRGGVNRKFHDGLSAFDKNEYRIYFTRNENKAKTANRIRELKLYSAKVNKDGSWYDVIPMSINLKGFSSCHPAISTSGKTLIFASNRPGGHGGMDLYISKKEDDKWSVPVNLGKHINTPNNEIFPTISRTNDLFFASNGHVGLGGLDVFRATTRNKRLDQNSEWKVQNMGKPFNSIKDDFSLSMAADGLSGYISSNREGGAGKDDIYRWVRTTDDPLVLDWYTKSLCIRHTYSRDNITDVDVLLLEFADALRYPEIITEGKNMLDDLSFENQQDILNVIEARQLRLIKVTKLEPKANGFDKVRMKPNRDYMVITQKNGFFVNKKLVTSSENSAVYSSCIDINMEPQRKLAGKLTIDREEVDLRKIAISLFDNCTKRNVLIYPEEDGSFTSQLKCSCSYEIAVDQFGFESFKKELDNYMENCKSLNENVSISLTNTNPFKKEKIERGKVFTLNNILYDYDSAILTQEALVELDYLVTAMRENPTMTIDMSSFTDSRGRREYNYYLSERRAKSAAEYLFQRGIDRTRVKYFGMGENKLLNDCKDGVNCSDLEHKINRRTEVRITSM